jgi:uncharacterized YccA/Bax inhibitor family protein
MLLATVTISGVLTVVGLIVLLIIAAAAFSYHVSCGGFFGWWMANIMFDAIGQIFAAIIEAIGDMRN